MALLSRNSSLCRRDAFVDVALIEAALNGHFVLSTRITGSGIG